MNCHAIQSAETIKASVEIFREGLKISSVQQMSIYKIVEQDPECPTRLVIEKYKREERHFDLTVRHINRLRRAWGLSRKKGRPSREEPARGSSGDGSVVVARPNISYAGLHFFDDWLEEREDLHELIITLKHAIEIYADSVPEDSFPLLKHGTETLTMRFKALLYAPLFGIGKLTEYDVKNHALKTIIGRGYQSSTLNQFLGQMERIDAAEALLPTLAQNRCGSLCYIDGHMIAFWTSVCMHKGKITMLGRIMPGSNAVVGHDENGGAVFLEYYPPDVRLTATIIEYCEKVVDQTGIRHFVIDREVNSEALASAFEVRGWGLLCMLDNNQYKDLSDWDVNPIGELEDGSKVYSGPWKDPGEDSRIFVIVEKENRLLPYWGTTHMKKVAEPIDWPKIYSKRTEVQENSFKRMKDHGALDVNFGTKTIEVDDRHHRNKLKKIEDGSASIQKRIESKEAKIEEQARKVEESKSKGHGKRLEQREWVLDKIRRERDELYKKKEVIEKKTEALGEPRIRFDRDFRKQKIMTFRTLYLENLLALFFSALKEMIDTPLSLTCLIELFFNRSGGYYETASEIMYLLNADGLSKSNKIKLEKIIRACCRMGLTRKGKTVRMKIRPSPQ